MMGRVEFVLEKSSENIRPYEDYGLLLVNYDVSFPRPRIFRADIEGQNGILDLTEWAGDLFFESRSATIRLRAMSGNVFDFVSKILGQRVNVLFYGDNNAGSDYYYAGRVDDIRETTRKHVTDLTIMLTCDPFKYPLLSDRTGQYARQGGVPYSGYYNLSAIIPDGESTTWNPVLHQAQSTITLTITDFVADNDASAITINGVSQSISENGIFTVSEHLHLGANEIVVTNGESEPFTVAIKFQNRVI